MLTRRASISILYNNVDITKDIKSDLESFNYTDNASGVADSISITLNNDSKKYLYSWKPVKGDSLIATINTLNWRYDNDQQKLACGKFIIDEVSYSGRPLTVDIGAISTPVSSDFINSKESRTWERVNVKEIAKSITAKHKINLFYDTDINPIIKFVEQDNMSDSEFLYGICKDRGLSVKVYNDRLVIFSEQEYESRAAITTLTESDIVSWSAINTWTDAGYSGCEVSCTDSLSGETYTYTFYDKNVKANKIFKVSKTVSSITEAELLAKSSLREVNKKEYSMSVDLPGNTDMIASSCVEIKGLGLFDGKYFIDTATHSHGGGYSTSLELHKVLEGY